MKRFFNNKGLYSILSMFVLSISAFGANAPCIWIYHDLEKPKELDSLKKY